MSNACGPSYVVVRTYVRRRRRFPQFQTFSPPKPLAQEKTKFYVEPPWVRGTKVCSRHPGHMTNIAATPIYGKNP